MKQSQVVDYIMEYEGGNLSRKSFFELFAHLIKTGQCWSLQGMYGGQAMALIEGGFISKEGKVDWEKVEEPEEMLYEEEEEIEDEEPEEEKECCVSCEEMKPKDEMYYSDDGKPVCEICYCEAEPIATVKYVNYESGEYGGDTDYITEWHNETPFKIEWKSTDAWRGHYEVVKSDGWENVHSDNILAYSDDASELKNFDEQIEDFCTEHNIPLAKVFCRSSNVFLRWYDVFVPNEYADDVKEFARRWSEGTETQ